MMYMWTKEEIEQILMQLDALYFPFQKYKFSVTNQSLRLLGTGGYASVYEAEPRGKRKREYAIKVIGFNGKHVDSSEFQKSVEAQKELSSFYDHIVKVYDYTELCVWIDEANHVVKVETMKEEEESALNENCLKLQFIVMEKVVPVISFGKSASPQLTPVALASKEEKEIVKLAYEIGEALTKAHDKKMLHRDVKLENIFYEPRGKHYKLGDFGISKLTDNGLASTSAYTKGYGAPEVVAALDEKYDNTADVYSFGMLLYVLLNGLRFPESDNYNVNIAMQYKPGYMFSKPEKVSEELFQIVEKMCRYNPDERYQSVNEMLNDLDKVAIDKVIGMKKNHEATTLVFGAVFLALGVLGVKQMSFPEFPMNFDVWTYVFFAIILVRMIQSLMKKDSTLCDIPILGIGIYLMIQSGFGWWKLVVLLFVAFTRGVITGIISIAMLLLNLVWVLGEYNFILPMLSRDYKWVFILLLSLAAILLWEYTILNMSDFKLKKMYYTKNIFWKRVYLIYVLCILYGVLFNSDSNVFFNAIYAFIERLTGKNPLDMFGSLELIKVGVLGLGFSIIWNAREKILDSSKKM